MTISPSCWRRFGEVIAADFSDPQRLAFHQVVVDAYAAQHPGEDHARQLQVWQTYADEHATVAGWLRVAGFEM